MADARARGVRVDVLGDFVRIWYVQNTGAAFSLFPGAIWLFVPVTVLALVMVGYFFRSFRDRGPWIHIVLGAILGGTLGNLTDRVRLGYVVDFISVGIGDCAVPDLQRRRFGGRASGSALLVAYLTFAEGRRHRTSRQRDAWRIERSRAPRRPAGSTWRSRPWPGSAGRTPSGSSATDGRSSTARGAGRATGSPGASGSASCSAPRRTRRSPPESIPLVVAYEDDDMLIVDKPAGLVVHPSAGHGSGTLVNALLGRARDRGEPLGSIAGVGRPGIVHRLDKETSGLIVVAKTDAAQASLMRQFGDRSVEKEYLALVRGEAPASRGRIEAPIGRDPRDRQRMAVVAGGRASVTEYEQLAAGGGYALLALRPLTGRTHQIRAHLAYLGPADRGRHALRRGRGPGRPAAPVPARGPARARAPVRRRAAARLERACRRPRRRASTAAGVAVAAGRLPAGVGAEVSVSVTAGASG